MTPIIIAEPSLGGGSFNLYLLTGFFLRCAQVFPERKSLSLTGFVD